MNMLVKSFVLSIFIVPLCFISPTQTNADIMECPTNTTKSTSSGICIPDTSYLKISNGSVYDTIFLVIKGVLAFLALLSILIIVAAGITYILAAGDQDRIENAKRWLLYAIIGLAVALLGFAIVIIVGGILGAGTTT